MKGRCIQQGHFNRYEEKSSEGFSFLNASSFTNCDVKIFVNEKK